MLYQYVLGERHISSQKPILPVFSCTASSSSFLQARYSRQMIPLSPDRQFRQFFEYAFQRTLIHHDLVCCLAIESDALMVKRVDFRTAFGKKGAGADLYIACDVFGTAVDEVMMPVFSVARY